MFTVIVIFICLLNLLIYKLAKKNLSRYLSLEFIYPNYSFTKSIHTVLILFISFLFPSNSFLICNSLKDKKTKSLKESLITGITVSIIIYSILRIMGFLLYGYEIDNTILECFNDEMIDYRNKNILIVILLIIICIGFISFCFIISFPNLFLSYRDDFIHLMIICSKSCSRNKKKENNKNKSINNINNKILIAITFVLYLLVVSIAILEIRLQAILSIVGEFAGIFFIFIFPNLFYIIIVKRARKNNNIVLPLLLIGFRSSLWYNSKLYVFDYIIDV